jgi:BirA family biotin operon repressor/biotin-[acetyl-CoA-carboxylase] ligase
MSQSDQIDVEAIERTGLAAHVEYLQSLGSTQDHAIELARSGARPLPLLVIAEEQTAGRGRGPNRWWTGRGSLAMSLVVDPAEWSSAGELPPARSLAVGVAIVETIRPHLPGMRPGLHWPNDVYVARRKIAGVLVDVLGGGRHVVGIGLNVNNSLADAPEDVRQRATSMRDLAGCAFERTKLVTDLLRHLRIALAEIAASPEEFGRHFGELCLQVGAELTVDAAGRRTTGLCAGIAPDGALLLETPSGYQKLYSGALVHGR